MSVRRVFGNRAGPAAIGLLIPPGQPTVVILRPRSLPWDLLCIQPDVEAIRFREFAREEAEAAAESLGTALEQSGPGKHPRIDTAPAPGSTGRCISIGLGRYHLIVCPRLPGQSYRPMVWGTDEEASEAAGALRELLAPSAGETREIYFNSSHFSR